MARRGCRASCSSLFFFFFNLADNRWTSSLPSCLWSQRIFPSLPGSRLTICLSRCKFSTLTTRQPMVEFYLVTFPRFPSRKKEHKSYFGKKRTHDFRTSRCADNLLDHLGDEGSRIAKRLFVLFRFFVSSSSSLSDLSKSPSVIRYTSASQCGLVRPELFLLGDGAIALRDSLALLRRSRTLVC